MLNWIKRLNYTYFHHIKLHKKLMYSYAVIVFIPVVILYFFSYSKISGILENNLLYSAAQSYEQTYSFVSYKLYKMIRTSDLIHSDEQLHRILTTDISKQSFVEQIDDMYLLQRYLSSFEDRQDISKVRLYVPSDFAYAQEGVHFLDIANAPLQPWFDLLASQDKKIIFAPSDYLIDTETSDLLSIIRPIFQLDNYNILEGYMRIDFSKDVLLEIIKNSTPSLSSFTLIMNTRGELILSSEEKTTLPTALLTNYGLTPEHLANYSKGVKDYERHTLGDHDFYVQSRTIANTDWFILTLIPYDEILSSIYEQRQALLIAFVLMLLAAISLGYLISHYITKRLNQLTTHMTTIESSHLLPHQFEEDQDEIGVLAKSYNQMLSQIDVLLDEQYESGKRIKSAELKAVQAQINPHFLYNTLEMINWMAKKQEIDRILLVTRELSRFYKLSLNKGNDFISLRDEFTHLNAYITIQNLRFENSITFVAHLDPDVANFIVPKIILQPLIENAITHGILEKPSSHGTLKVSALRVDAAVEIHVEDDGAGMSEAKLATLFLAPAFDPFDDLTALNSGSSHNDSSDHSGSHYGLYNIKERLDLYYNGQATVTIHSQLGQGTQIILRFN